MLPSLKIVSTGFLKGMNHPSKTETMVVIVSSLKSENNPLFFFLRGGLCADAALVQVGCCCRGRFSSLFAMPILEFSDLSRLPTHDAASTTRNHKRSSHNCRLCCDVIELRKTHENHCWRKTGVKGKFIRR